MRLNEHGILRVPWGYVGALQCDPIEKKPFFHLYAGMDALTFGMLGCDFHCSYCQNWVNSQALRDPASDFAGSNVRRITPKEIVAHGIKLGAKVVASSYNEPLITSEWAIAVFEEANKAGMINAFISNGNATPEVLDYIKPYVSAYKIDLKTMQDKQYRRLGGVLQHVLDAIRLVYEMGYWLEVVTLVIPGFNDSVDELMDAARTICAISPNIPWHVTAFHRDYKMIDPPPTTVKTLIRAAEIGREAGLNYVYAGNLPGRVGDYENTTCPHCGYAVIKRMGYTITDYEIDASGACLKCGTTIAGVWTHNPDEVLKGMNQYKFPRPVS